MYTAVCRLEQAPSSSRSQMPAQEPSPASMGIAASLWISMAQCTVVAQAFRDLYSGCPLVQRCQCRLLSLAACDVAVLCTCGAQPLQAWDLCVPSGYWCRCGRRLLRKIGSRSMTINTTCLGRIVSRLHNKLPRHVCVACAAPADLSTHMGAASIPTVNALDEVRARTV